MSAVERLIQFFKEYLWLAFPALYLLLVSYFLNQIHDLKVLVPSASGQQNFIYFASDIFDVFWLIIAAIPNVLFAGAYYLKIASIFEGNRKSSWFIFFTLLIIVTTIAAWYGFISPSTTDFSSHSNVWSYKLPLHTLRAYKLFELISILAISSEAVSTIFYIFSCIFHKKSASDLGAIPTYALIASITMFLYWLMLVLSNISNMKISVNTVGDPNIFPKYYGQLGSIAMLAVTICTYLFWEVFSKTPSYDQPNLTGIIGSILFPGAAIVLQIIQIL